MLVLDGLNKLDTKDLSFLLLRTYPKHIRVIVSMLSAPQTVAKNPILQVQPLPQSAAEDLVRHYLLGFRKKLNEDPTNGMLGNQMATLMSKRDFGYPLYLLSAASELVCFGVYEQVDYLL